MCVVKNFPLKPFIKLHLHFKNCITILCKQTMYHFWKIWFIFVFKKKTFLVKKKINNLLCKKNFFNRFTLNLWLGIYRFYGRFHGCVIDRFYGRFGFGPKPRLKTETEPNRPFTSLDKHFFMFMTFYNSSQSLSLMFGLK